MRRDNSIMSYCVSYGVLDRVIWAKSDQIDIAYSVSGIVIWAESKQLNFEAFFSLFDCIVDLRNDLHRKEHLNRYGSKSWFSDFDGLSVG